MIKTIITQSNYIPWRGYFAMIAEADELILLDCVQYTRRDWRNRNVIKTPSGLQWLTIPVDVKGKYLQAVDETRIAEKAWAESHIRALQASYRRAEAFETVAPKLFKIMSEASILPLLTQVNAYLLREICKTLGIATPIRQCVDVLPRRDLIAMGATDRLINLCAASQATRYLSGPAAKDYIDLDKFERAGIEVIWMEYSGFPEYRQCWGGFEPKVSIVDLLLNCGNSSSNFLQRHGD